jgi:hypothetical protein
MSLNLPNFKKTSETCQKVLEDMVVYNNLSKAIQSLSLSKPEVESEEATKKRKETLYKAESIPTLNSPVFTSESKEKREKESDRERSKKKKEEKVSEDNVRKDVAKDSTFITLKPSKK